LGNLIKNTTYSKRSISKTTNTSKKSIVVHKAKVLSPADVHANRSQAYSFLPL